MPQTRPAAVAGTFYPGDAQSLRDAVADHLADATTRQQADADRARRPPKMLVVPHAGYIYSGDIAASAYALLAPWRERIRRVVLLGPTHRVAVRGLVAPQADSFETPLGRVAIDRAALARIADLPQVLQSDRPHALEHSLEVQLPFLQTVLGSGFGLVPLAVGEASPQQVDEVVERLWGGDETLVLISSDLSHYLPYAEARQRDQATVQRILAFAGDLRGDEACGAMPLNGALRTARRHGLRPRLLDLRNSGDTAGDRQRVVGYGAIAFDTAPPATTDDDDAAADASDATLGPALLATARAEIAGALGLAAPHTPGHARLLAPGASFVTLHDARGALRGCVGQLQAQRPLGEDVRHNALAAAFGDRRFQPLTAAEWTGLHVEVSVLGPLQPMVGVGHFDAVAGQLRPGVDGVLLEWRGRRGTFLPQVWSQLPEPRRFLQALLQKAGLPLDFWALDMQLWRYQVTPFEEPRHERTH
jgi:hypothetical protein